MGSLTAKWKKHSVFIISFLLICILLIIYALQLSVPVISDETVTMANAANLAGYDWSLMVAATGGRYYKYLQPLLMAPLFMITDDPEVIYRTVMCIHALLQASVMVAAYVIGRRYLKIRNEIICILLSMAACLVPALVLYSYYFRGDILLGILPWYTMVAFLETMRAEEEEKKIRRAVFSAVAVSFSILAYMAHTRGIVLIIALILSALVIRIFGKKRSLNWIVVLLAAILMLGIDSGISDYFRNALYSISGVNANTVSSTDMGSFFDLFSLTRIKGMIMLCISWMYTLFSTTYGLLLTGCFVSMIVLVRGYLLKSAAFTDEEKAVALFGFVVFVGYFLIGALFFKGIYTELSSGALQERSDRLLYDRYAICGCGIPVYFSLYSLTCRENWIRWKSKAVCMGTGILILVVFFWKPVQLAVKYPGYIYNTIILATFQNLKEPCDIMWGECYSKTALLACAALAVIVLSIILLLSCFQRRWVPYVILSGVLIGELALVQVNYGKVRKATNDYTIESTAEVVNFLKDMEDDITEEFPYILKGGLSGVKIQFYQSQLMKYQMFGKKKLEKVEADSDSYFIISQHGDIDMRYYEDDYYLFEEFDYDSAEYDIVYIKGEALKEKLETLGYKTKSYDPIEEW